MELLEGSYEEFIFNSYQDAPGFEEWIVLRSHCLTVSLLTLLHDKQRLMSVQVFNVESSEDLAAV